MKIQEFILLALWIIATFGILFLAALLGGSSN